MKIKFKYIQSYEEVLFILPDTGLVQILGNNSNGKSIISKVLKRVATLEFFDQITRDALIQDDQEAGYVIIEYKGKGLIVYLHRDRNQCYVTLIRTNGEKVTRTIRDGGIDKLLEEFGFRVYGKNSIVLQVRETYGNLPFVTTTPSQNYEMVDSVMTDNVAQEFLQNFKEYTHKTAKELLSKYNTKLDAIDRAVSTLALYDHVAYQDLHDRMMECYNVIKHLKPLKLERIVIPKKVEVVRVPKLELAPIRVLKVIKPLQPLKNLSDTFYRAHELSQGRCPTCGKLITGDICLGKGGVSKC